MNVTQHNKGRKLPVELLTATDIARLLRACNNGPTGHRNRALIVTLWRSGLRISECLALELKDIDLDTGTIHVLHGKGNRSRHVAIDAAARTALRDWLAARATTGPNGTRVFCTFSGQPITDSYVRQLLPRLALAAGVQKRVHAHAFRHAHAVELLNERLPLNAIQSQLGHSSLTTTSRYLQHVAQPELIHFMRNRTVPAGVAEALR